MIENQQHLDSIRNIRQMMEKSSRFISLSGLSGVAAGLCALVAAYIAHGKINAISDRDYLRGSPILHTRYDVTLDLVALAAVTFVAALALAFLFTYLRSRKIGIPIWGFTARRVMFAVALPMVVGGLVLLRMLERGDYGLIAPSCLVFYGLALVNASKFTLDEIRYLGYGQLVLGVVNLWMPGQGLYFWALGFGLLHIVYGIVMWNRYERQKGEPA